MIWASLIIQCLKANTACCASMAQVVSMNICWTYNSKIFSKTKTTAQTWPAGGVGCWMAQRADRWIYKVYDCYSEHNRLSSPNGYMSSRYSKNKWVVQTVTCHSCYRENEVLWPKGNTSSLVQGWQESNHSTSLLLFHVGLPCILSTKQIGAQEHPINCHVVNARHVRPGCHSPIVQLPADSSQVCWVVVATCTRSLVIQSAACITRGHTQTCSQYMRT